MGNKAIRLPNGKWCGLGHYVYAWHALKAAEPRENIAGFQHFPTPAAEILQELRYGMHDRINRHIPAYGAGRKWDADWQRAAIQCAHQVNEPRLVVRWVPKDLKARLAHRIHQEDC